MLIACAISLNACSVAMSLNGKKDPDLSVIKQGAHRSEVELQLGSPVQVANHANGTSTSTYEYDIGNEPSAGRAVAHGVMDVMTLGLWEVVGTPIEIANGDKYKINVHYDKNDLVIPTSGAPKKK